MSPDQDVGAALPLPTVGRPGAVDVGGAGEDGVAAGVLVVGSGVGAVGAVTGLVVSVPETDDVVPGAVLRARLLVDGAAGWGATTPPAGVDVCVAVGCTLR